MFNIKPLYYMGFVLAFLPCFVIFIVPNSSLYVHAGLIFWCFLYLFFLFRQNNIFLRNFKYLFASKLFFLYLICFIYITIDTVYHLLAGYSLASWYLNLFFYIRSLSVVVLVYFLPLLSLSCNIKLKKIIQVIYIMCLLICILGLLQYIGFKLLNANIISFLTNSRYGYPEWADVLNSKVFSVFNEPNRFGDFIFQYLPVFTVILFSQYRIFKNKYINYLTKRMIVPLLFLMLFLTKSPIWLIFILIEFVIMIFAIKRNFIKRNYHIITSTLVTIVVLIFISVGMVNLLNIGGNRAEDAYLSRITTVISYKDDFSKLAKNEASLATRLISDIYNIKIFKLHPVFGVGYNISSSYSDRLITHSDIPLTLEFINKYIKNKYPTLNSSLLFTSLSEFGIIGTLLFYIFLFYNIFLLDKLQKKFTIMPSKQLCKGIKYAIIARVCVSFYDFNMYNILFWLLIGFVPYLYVYQKYYEQNILYEKE